MTAGGIFALFGAMLAIAVVPGPGQVAVVARTSASGFAHGLLTAVGIVFGDYVLIAIAVFGLSALAQSWAGVFSAGGALGGGYLIWLGVQTLRRQPQRVEIKAVEVPSWSSDFAAGILVTLGDPKAVVFYISFLPAFVDMQRISGSDVMIIMVVATVVVLGVAIAYAYMAERAKALFRGEGGRRLLDIAASGALLVVGLFMIVRSLIGHSS